MSDIKTQVKQAIKELFESGELDIRANIESGGYREGNVLYLSVHIDNEVVYEHKGDVQIQISDH